MYYCKTPFSLYFLISLIIFLLFPHILAFNITKILDPHQEFNKFNNYLTKTQLFSEINTKQTITVLVVDNSVISSLSNKPINVLKKILSIHILLDYYDIKKLENLPNNTKEVATLFQSSGTATDSKGFITITSPSEGVPRFSSASSNSSSGAKLISSVWSQPYNISVLQINNLIIPNGIYNGSSSPTLPPSESSSSAPPSAADAPSNSHKNNSGAMAVGKSIKFLLIVIVLMII